MRTTVNLPELVFYHRPRARWSRVGAAGRFAAQLVVAAARSSGFVEQMPKTLATETVERLLHYTHVFQTSGDSIRLTRAP